MACTSKGIYAASFNTRTGALGTPTLAGESVNPSYLAVHPGGRFLYAVNEIDDWKVSTAAGAAGAAGGKPEKTGASRRSPSSRAASCA